MGSFPRAIKNRKTMLAVKKSSATMIFRLFTLSAKIPPKNERKIMGRKEDAVTIPKRDAEPVSRKR